MKVDVDVATLSKVVQLHEYAYTVLNWLDERGRAEPAFLAEAAPAVVEPAIAEPWLRASWAELPEAGRPDPRDDDAVRRLAGLLASFFRVSFQIAIDRGPDGTLLAAKVLHRPTSRRRLKLGSIEVQALQRLAIDAGIRPTRDELHAWRTRVADQDVETWLYGMELVCRSEGRTQGVPAMRLWRRLTPAQRDTLGASIEQARERLLAELVPCDPE